MKTTPHVSIIMPFYNRYDVVFTTLDSIRQQTYQDWELIAVDDGSTDQVPRILATYAAQDPRIRVFTKPHTNAGDARNLGITHSRGQYLFFLDADDIYAPNFIQRMVTVLAQEHSDVVICQNDEFDHTTGATLRTCDFRNVPMHGPVTTLTPAQFTHPLWQMTRAAAWHKIFRRDLIDRWQLRFMSLSCMNDQYFVYAYLTRCQQVTFLDEVLVHHRVHDPRSVANQANHDSNPWDYCRALAALATLNLPDFTTYYDRKIAIACQRTDFQTAAQIRRYAALQKNNFTKPQPSSRILLLIENLADGGTQRMVTLHAQILATAGYQVTVLTYYPTPDEYPLDHRIVRHNLFTQAAAYQQTRFPTLTCRQLLAAYLTAHPQDLLIPYLSHANFVAATVNTPAAGIVVQTLRNSPWHHERGHELIRRDWAIAQHRHLLIQNTTQKSYFCKPQFHGLQTTVITNPLHPDLHQHLKSDYHVIQKIIAVGRLTPQKNHRLMLEAIRILRDQYHEIYHLDIYGVGPELSNLQQMVATNHLQDQIKFCGFCPDIFTIAPQYDLFLLTSRYEGTPNALLEAMGMGLPVVTTKFSPDAARIIQNGRNGYLLPNFQATTLAQLLHQSNQPQLLQTVGRQARRDVQQRFAPEVCTTQLLTWVAQVLQQKNQFRPLSVKALIKLHQRTANYDTLYPAIWDKMTTAPTDNHNSQLLWQLTQKLLPAAIHQDPARYSDWLAIVTKLLPNLPAANLPATWHHATKYLPRIATANPQAVDDFVACTQAIFHVATPTLRSSIFHDFHRLLPLLTTSGKKNYADNWLTLATALLNSAPLPWLWLHATKLVRTFPHDHHVSNVFVACTQAIFHVAIPRLRRTIVNDFYQLLPLLSPNLGKDYANDWLVLAQKLFTDNITTAPKFVILHQIATLFKDQGYDDWLAMARQLFAAGTTKQRLTIFQTLGDFILPALNLGQNYWDDWWQLLSQLQPQLSGRQNNAVYTQLVRILTQTPTITPEYLFKFREFTLTKITRVPHNQLPFFVQTTTNVLDHAQKIGCDYWATYYDLNFCLLKQLAPATGQKIFNFTRLLFVPRHLTLTGHEQKFLYLCLQNNCYPTFMAALHGDVPKLIALPPESSL